MQEANSPERIQARPHWIPAGNITTASFQTNVVQYLREVGGGSYGIVLIAPNNIIQICNVRERLSRDIEMNPFIQECLQQLPVGAVLGVLGIMPDRVVTHALPLDRQPPAAANARLMFM